MPKGGARNRSGPQPDPSSARSELRGYRLDALPNEGYQGAPPEFPLPALPRGTRRDRELQIWAEEWRTPQACAWISEPWRWPVLAEFCRLRATVESRADPSAGLVTQLHRFRDQLGLTPAGLRENGWKIVRDELAARRSHSGQSEPEPVHSSSRDRMKVVGA